MPIFEQVIDPLIRTLLPQISQYSEFFYLGGGTGLALQIGHRKSEDLDFFTDQPFNEKYFASKLQDFQVIQQYRGTIHGVLKGIRVSFLHYSIPLLNETIEWQGIRIASLPDLIAEKFKTVSQRGAKKDFCDLYAVFHSGISIPQGCQYFKQRFANTGVQFYSILKGLTYFEDAQSDPEPKWLPLNYSVDWNDIMNYFTENIRLFEEALLN